MTDIIIDCDPGIDDALALLLAAGSSTELNLLAVTTVAGNRPLDTTSMNACRILDLAGRCDIPVYAGQDRPLCGAEPRCNLVHGEGGLGGLVLPTKSRPREMHAVSFIAQTLLRLPPRRVKLVAMGPLTNLAATEIKYPGILARAKSVLMMGGAVFREGNVTPFAEFNVYADPLAAEVVMGAGVEVKLFGLDVSSKAIMSPDWIASLGELGNRCGAAARTMLNGYASRAPRLHDACPVGYAIDPTLFVGERCAISVVTTDGPEQGRTVARHESSGKAPPAHNARVFTDVDGPRLMNLVKTKIALLP